MLREGGGEIGQRLSVWVNSDWGTTLLGFEGVCCLRANRPSVIFLVDGRRPAPFNKANDIILM